MADPITDTLGLAISAIGFLASALSGIITVIKFIVYYAIFFAIIILIGVNLFHVVGGVHFLNWLSNIIGAANANCIPPVPT